MYQFKTLFFVFIFAQTSIAQNFSFTETIPVPFGPYADLVKAASQDGLAELVRTGDCDKVGSSEDKRPKKKQYKCGEYPIGEITGKDWKLLDTMNLGKEFADKKGKNEFSFKNAKGGNIALNLFLSRYQKSDTVEISTLAEMGKEKVELSRGLGRDLFVKLTPAADEVLQQRACLYTPGLKARASDVKLKGKIRRKDAFCFLWCFDAKAEGTVDIDFGHLAIESGKTCVDIATKMVNGKPVLKLSGGADLDLNGVKHSGLKVKANMKATDWISKVLEFFGVEVSEMISDAVAKAVRKETGNIVDMNLKKIKSGEYFKDYLDKTKLKPLVKALNGKIESSLQKLSPEKKISEAIRDLVCVEPISQLDLPLAERRELLKACRVTTSLDFTGFKSHSESRNDGCYKHFFKTNQSLKDSDRRLKWREACAFGVGFDIDVNVKMSEVGKCIYKAWRNNKLPSEECVTQFTNLLGKYEAGDLDALLDKTNAKEIADLNEKDITVIRRLSREHFGVEAPGAAKLVELLNK